MTLREINTLEWDELLVTNDTSDATVSRRGNRRVSSLSSSTSLIFELLTYFAVMADKNSCFDQRNQITVNDFSNDVSRTSS